MMLKKLLIKLMHYRFFFLTKIRKTMSYKHTHTHTPLPQPKSRDLVLSAETLKVLPLKSGHRQEYPLLSNFSL